MNRRSLISAALAMPLAAVHAADVAPHFQYPEQFVAHLDLFLA